MKFRLFVTVFVLLIAFMLISNITQSATVNNANAVVERLNNPSMDIGSSDVSSSKSIAVGVVTVLVLLAIWGGKILQLYKDKFYLALVIPLALIMTGCSSPKFLVIVDTNETAFVIPVRANADIVVVGQEPTTNISGTQNEEQVKIDQQVKFWSEHINPNREIEIPSYCWKSRDTDLLCDYRPVDYVITVPNTEETFSWAAPTVVDGKLTNYENSFALQSLEDNHGSLGVYIGAQISAKICEPTKYLANYPPATSPDASGAYPAKPLLDVIRNEMRTYIQIALANEYAVLSVAEQNDEIVPIFQRISGKLKQHFADKGICVINFGFEGGNVYENDEVQKSFDSIQQRELALQEAKAALDVQKITNEQNLIKAQAAAEETKIAVISEVNRQNQLGQAYRDNPSLLLGAAIDKWDGKFPIIFGSNGGSEVFSLDKLLNMMQSGAIVTVTSVPQITATPSQ